MFWFKKENCNLKINNIESQVIYAPIKGKRLELETVEDKVFSEKLLGDGVAVEPEDNKLYSPVSGIISVVFPTRHVIGIKAENGADLIIHVGIDTVELKGEGFITKVKEGDRVKAGELLMEIDLKLIKKNYKATTMIVIENFTEYTLEHNLTQNVLAGNELMRIQRE